MKKNILNEKGNWVLEKIKNNFKDYWLYVPVIILFLYFIYRLIDQSQLLFYFPLDYNNDVSSYMAQLFFLKECGFLNFCSYWYNGFISFQSTSPGWFFFALPFYYFFGDVKVATYITMILSFLLAFLVIYFSGKYFNMNKIRRLAFFIFMFGNSFAIGSFIRLGRVHELFAWVWFLLFIFLVLYFKDRKLNKFSLLIIPSYALVVFSYLSVGVIASLVFIGFFSVKSKIEKLYVVLYFLISLLLISFWLIPFTIGIFTTSSIPSMLQGTWLWNFNTSEIFTNIAISFVSLSVFVLFYFYWISHKKSKKELYFFSPILVFVVLYFFRLTPFIPIFRNIFPDPYLTFFLFFSLFFLFNSDFNYFKKNILNILGIILIIFAVLSVTINFIHTPKFIVPDNSIRNNFEPLLNKFNGSFLIFGDYPKLYSKAVYSYAPIYHNLSTPLGWYPEVKERAYFDKFSSFDINSNCTNLLRELKNYNTTNLIGDNSACAKFNSCNFKLIDKKGTFCLYTIY